MPLSDSLFSFMLTKNSQNIIGGRYITSKDNLKGGNKQINILLNIRDNIKYINGRKRESIQEGHLNWQRIQQRLGP